MENNNNLKHVQRVLMATFCGVIFGALLLVVLFENETIPTGLLATEKQLEFVLATLMELLTIALIPLALRLFKFRKVSSELQQRQVEALRKWGHLRLAMLEFPLMANTILYYLFMNTAFGYMAIIVLLCMPFVYPSIKRCQAEIA